MCLFSGAHGKQTSILFFGTNRLLSALEWCENEVFHLENVSSRTAIVFSMLPNGTADVSVDVLVLASPRNHN